MGNLPFTSFKDVNVRVSGLDLVAGGSHGEFVDTDILAPAISNSGIRLQNNTLGLLLQKVDKVVLDGGVVSTRLIRNSGQQNSVAGVSLGNDIGVQSRKGVVPEVEQVLDFVLGNAGSSGRFGHHGRVVVGNLPLTIFVDVNKGVSGLDLISGSTHGEFIDTDILGPTITDGDERVNNFSLGLLEQKCVEIVLDGFVVGTGNIRNGGEKDGFLGVSLGNDIRVKSVCEEGKIEEESTE